MNFQYTYDLTSFPNNKYSEDSLSKEIQDSAIIISLDYITGYTSNIGIFFKAELSDTDENILDDIISQHQGVPLLVSTIQDVNIITENKKTIESGYDLPNKF